MRREMMTFLLLRLLLITLVGIWIAGAQSCPQKCQCRKSLTIVDCRNRGLVNIPSQFPSNVIEITLDKNAFGMIPAKAFVSAPNLQRLSMKSCSIDSIDPAAFTDLKNLSLLSMTGNLLKSTDYDTIICDQLPQLKTLLMGQNRMTEIPNLMKCKNLMKLGLEVI
ncbi:chondroadherin-like protein isoform X2 [Tubulanus polymorphus]|uniref:chondroadherin-like protein isoform X2 n=1 Tax=Tubulanus polymorphus TaxID=672921 RepID=UPI003DA3E66F